MVKRSSFDSRGHRPLHLILTLLCLLLIGIVLGGCSRSVDLTEYVSEYRNNLFVYQGESFSVKAQNVEKEHPYVADGYKGEITHRAELYIAAPPKTQNCKIFFIADGIEHSGEASYDNVKKQFYYSCAADLSNTETLPLRLTFDESEQEITLASVKTHDLMELKELLNTLQQAEPELLKTLTHDNEFAGELYVRLLYEDAPYYYVGVVDRSGNITAVLMDGKTGKILAKRTV